MEATQQVDARWLAYGFSTLREADLSGRDPSGTIAP
jgi:hypothetical protein